MAHDSLTQISADPQGERLARVSPFPELSDETYGAAVTALRSGSVAWVVVTGVLS